MQSSAPVTRIEAALSIVFVSVICLATYARVFFGVSVGDEAHYAAMASLPFLGGEWFVHEKTIQQVSAMLLTPLVWLYSKVAGTYGIYLFLRHLHFLMSLVTAACVFRLLRHFLRWPQALALAALTVAFVPNSMPSLLYNSMGSHFFGMATALGALATLEKRRLWAVLSGFSWVLCGFSYPTLIVPFGFFALGVLWWWGKQADTRKALLWPWAFAVGTMALILGGYLLSCGVDNIRSAVEFSSLFANPGSLDKLNYAFWMTWVYLPHPFFVLPLLVVWIVAAWFYPALHPFSLLLFLLGFVFLGGTFESMPTQVLWPVVQLFVLYHLVAVRGKLSTPEKQVVSLIVIPAIVGSVVACLTSRMTLYSMCLTGVFGAIVAIALIVRGSRVAASITAVLLCTFTTFWYYSEIYEDDKITRLDYRIERGPFAGLHTFEQKGKMIEQIDIDLQASGIEGKTILFKDLFPAGYLMAPNKILGPTIYFAPANFYPVARQLYTRIFADRAYWPEVVVELKFYPVRDKDVWPYNVEGLDPYQDPFRDFFMQTGAYEVLLDRFTHRFLKRKY